MEKTGYRNNSKAKARLEHGQKKERTVFEQSVGRLTKAQDLTNLLLTIIAMLLTGLFVRIIAEGVLF